MNGIVITKSEMKFGPFLEENFFKIENSKLHKSLGQGFKIVEFVVLKGDKILFVEAKPNRYILSVGNPKLDEKIKELQEKFENSLDLFLSVRVGIREDSYRQIGENLVYKELSTVKGRFFLVIKDADESLCEKLTVTLQDVMRRKLAIHKFELMVINCLW